MTITLNRPEAFQRRPHGVLFDTDNTLYPYETAHLAGMQAVRSKTEKLFGLEASRFDAAFNSSRKAIKDRLKATASSHSRLLYFQQMLESIGLGSQVLLALDLEQTYWRTFLSKACLFDGVKEFFDDLRIANIPIAIVTDLTAQIQFRKIVYFGLDHYVDHIVTSEEAGFDKPHPAPFELARDKMKVRGSYIWMIGDNAITDIEGARNAIQAVTVQKLHAGVKPGIGHGLADATITDFESLRAFFASLPGSAKK